jgi:hypothetical protein
MAVYSGGGVYLISGIDIYEQESDEGYAQPKRNETGVLRMEQVFL